MGMPLADLRSSFTTVTTVSVGIASTAILAAGTRRVALIIHPLALVNLTVNLTAAAVLNEGMNLYGGVAGKIDLDFARHGNLVTRTVNGIVSGAASVNVTVYEVSRGNT